MGDFLFCSFFHRRFSLVASPCALVSCRFINFVFSPRGPRKYDNVSSQNRPGINIDRKRGNLDYELHTLRDPCRPGRDSGMYRDLSEIQQRRVSDGNVYVVAVYNITHAVFNCPWSTANLGRFCWWITLHSPIVLPLCLLENFCKRYEI